MCEYVEGMGTLSSFVLNLLCRTDGGSSLSVNASLIIEFCVSGLRAEFVSILENMIEPSLWRVQLPLSLIPEGSYDFELVLGVRTL